MSPVVIVTDRLIPSGVDALTVWPFVFLRPASRNDKALIEHELVHWREQAWRPTWWLCYLASKQFRQAAEIRGYARQIALGGISIERAADYLAVSYRLHIEPRRARELLQVQLLVDRLTAAQAPTNS